MSVACIFNVLLCRNEKEENFLFKFCTFKQLSITTHSLFVLRFGVDAKDTTRNFDRYR